MRWTAAAAAVAAVALWLPASAPTAEAAVRWDPHSLTEIYKPSGGLFYTYAPSVIKEGRRLRIWSCHNLDSGVVRDHVFYTKREHGVVTADKSVLGPDTSGTWDSFHICDPSVIGGRFRLQGTSYRYALFFLGNNVDASTNNQIGVAFSNNLSGPWTRYPQPIVTYPPSGAWGIGQPSAVSLDRNGKVLLFFTHGGPDGTYGVWETLDLSDMDHPVLGPATPVPTAGLIGRDGNQDVLNNFDVAYDPRRDRYYMIRDQHPSATDDPNYVSVSVQLDSISREGLLSGHGTWTVEGNITPELTGFPRNHDAGLVRTLYGQLPDKHTVSVVFATSCAGAGCKGTAPLWTYTLWEVTGRLTG